MTATTYYSGQGEVSFSPYVSAGGAGTWTAIGNVSDMKVSIATSVVDHKESMSGLRSIDLRLFTEIKVQVSITMENFTAANLVQALWGTQSGSAGNYTVEALTNLATPISVKLDAVNTASANAASSIRVFKFIPDPMKELNLISDTIQKFTLEGIALMDSSIVTAGLSKYFKITSVPQ